MEEACGVVDVKRVASVADRGMVKLRAQMRDRELGGVVAALWFYIEM